MQLMLITLLGACEELRVRLHCKKKYPYIDGYFVASGHDFIFQTLNTNLTNVTLLLGYV